MKPWPSLTGTSRIVDDGGTDLLAALMSGDRDRVRAALAARPEPHARLADASSSTPLMWALLLKEWGVVGVCLETGAPLDDAHNGGSVLGMIMPQGDAVLSWIATLYERGAPLPGHNQRGWPPLVEAIDRGHDRLARWLIRQGVEVSGSPGATEIPLHRCAAQSNAKIARLLLRKGADPNERDSTGDTPLHTASRSGPAAAGVAHWLLESGADPEAVAVWGGRACTPANVSEWFGPWLVARRLEHSLVSSSPPNSSRPRL